MKIRLIGWTSMVLSLCVVLQACGSMTAAPTAIPPQPTYTQPAPVVVAATTSVPTQPPAPTATSTLTPEPTKIKHMTKPGEPAYIAEQTNIDCTIGRTYVSDLPVAIPAACDNPVVGFIERPVTADTKDYLPYLDIGQTHFGGNIDWIFARVDIYDAVATIGVGDVYYFFKLDLNYDGRNSNVILIAVKNLPLNTLNWTVNGVQAWRYVDGTISTVFDQGVGADPDLIWVRRSPKAIEMAFKPAILNGPFRFAWTAWDYQGILTPIDIAFSSTASDLYQIDNTCAWGFNVSAFGLINHCIRE